MVSIVSKSAGTVLVLPQRTLRYRRLAVITFIIIPVLLCVPGPWMEGLRSWVYVLLQLPPAELVPSDFPTDKLIHASLFAICAAFFVRGWSTFREHWWWVCALLFFYGALTEFVQRFVPGRSSTLGDLLADAMGAVVGAGVTLLYLRLRPKEE